jgi:uncharacterized repeat protein (TIGR03803 family)
MRKETMKLRILVCAALLLLPVWAASAGVVFTNLFSFNGTNGAYPVAGLVQGTDGNFYGTTSYSQVATSQYDDFGTVFKISTNGAFTSLYTFDSVTDTNGYYVDGADPVGVLVQGTDGFFYGTTYAGGTNCEGRCTWGTVFKISPDGAYANLYSFGTIQDENGDPLDGANPSAGLVQGNDGFFYGTTFEGGTNGGGTVFKISANGELKTLYSFIYGNSATNAGALPRAPLVQGRDGNFYGTTYIGGTNGSWGTVFKISPNGALTSLYSFGAVKDTNGIPLDGYYPYAGLVQGSDGNFYGTTYQGGTNNDGTVFKINTNGALTSLHSFGHTSDGGNPAATMVLGSDGYFYGTSSSIVFTISANGAFTSLYSFTNDYSANQLVQGSDGNFYGTIDGGGAYGFGTVFRLTLSPITTLPATDVGNLSAALNGSVNPNGSAATTYFQYGTDTNYGTATPSQSIGAGSNGFAAMTANISGLATNTIYHYQAVAVIGGTTYYGNDQTVTTQPSLLALASLSDDAYASSPVGYAGPPAYRSISTFAGPPPVEGFSANSYASADNSQFVIAYRGTYANPSIDFFATLDNIIVDLGFLNGDPSSGLDAYANAAALFVQNVQGQFTNANITVTGHSLGGALALEVGEASGLTAIGFNAPESYGVYFGILPELLSGLGTSLVSRIYG